MNIFNNFNYKCLHYFGYLQILWPSSDYHQPLLHLHIFKYSRDQHLDRCWIVRVMMGLTPLPKILPGCEFTPSTLTTTDWDIDQYQRRQHLWGIAAHSIATSVERRNKQFISLCKLCCLSNQSMSVWWHCFRGFNLPPARFIHGRFYPGICFCCQERPYHPSVAFASTQQSKVHGASIGRSDNFASMAISIQKLVQC